VLDAVESLGFAPDNRLFALNSYENRVYQIGLEQAEPIIVKFYRPGRWTDEQILEEHQFAQELLDLDLPVVAPQQFADQQTLQRFEDFRLAVFPRCIGRPPELDDLDNLLILGRFIGRMHLVGATTSFQHRLNLTVDHFAEASREFLLSHDFIPPDLVRAYDTLSRDIIDAVTQRFDQCGTISSIRIHGDCHPGNVLWSESCPNFVDFDDTMMGPAIQDIWMLFSGDRNQQQAQLLEIAEGYNEFNDFPVRELQLVESMRSLRLLYYSAWLARRWQDPAFPMSFPWFNTERYWADHILELREQLAALGEPVLELI